MQTFLGGGVAKIEENSLSIHELSNVLRSLSSYYTGVGKN